MTLEIEKAATGGWCAWVCAGEGEDGDGNDVDVDGAFGDADTVVWVGDVGATAGEDDDAPVCPPINVCGLGPPPPPPSPAYAEAGETGEETTGADIGTGRGIGVARDEAVCEGGEEEAAVALVTVVGRACRPNDSDDDAARETGVNDDDDDADDDADTDASRGGEVGRRPVLASMCGDVGRGLGCKEGSSCCCCCWCC